jgi:hypothetical protein
MKIMVISDIHGSSAACKKAVDAFKREGADKLLILGDILYHGPRNDLPEGYAPKQVFAMLNAIKDKIICVRGNCDAEVDQCVLEFPIMADYVLLNVGEKTIFATHGQKLDEQKTLTKSVNVVFSGHTHVSKLKEEGGVLWVNPGSISIPKENTKPSYAVIETGRSLFGGGDKISIKTLSGDLIMSSKF